MSSTSPLDDVLLATGFYVSDYRRFESEKNKDELATFIYKRFSERYLEVISNDKKKKNGFGMMALSCLMIESLESFYQGWPGTNERGKGQMAFCYFFQRNTDFNVFLESCDKFYKHVRCGILHQAETTDGWKIRRDQGVLFNKVSKTIDANCFRDSLKKALESYRDELKAEDWNSLLWKRFRDKMEVVIVNCK